MRIKCAVACLLGGLMLVAPASAQPVTYQVDLMYETIVDGVRPIQVVRVTIPGFSAEAAWSMCGSSTNMLRLSRSLLHKNRYALGLTGSVMGAGGTCVTDKDGNIQMTVQD